jgi:hypothetical protein
MGPSPVGGPPTGQNSASRADPAVQADSSGVGGRVADFRPEPDTRLPVQRIQLLELRAPVKRSGARVEGEVDHGSLAAGVPQSTRTRPSLSLNQILKALHFAISEYFRSVRSDND